MIGIWLKLFPLALVTYPMLFSVKKNITGAARRPNGVDFGKR